MKVLLINGSPRKAGNTYRALSEVAATLESLGVDSEIVHIGTAPVQGCIACFRCKGLGHCVFNDPLYMTMREKLEEADGIIVGSPVYYASANGTLIACLDRLFYSTHYDMSMKVGASIVAARRGGCTASFDVLNKYFSISGMPTVSSYYWDQIHGKSYEEAECDLEGLDTMRSLGRNMAFLIKAIKDAKEKYTSPTRPNKVYTNFIR